MDNIKDLEYFLESVLVIALSHSFTSDSGKALPSQTRFEYVNSIIKGMPVSKTDEDNDQERKESEENEKENREQDFNEQRSEAWVTWSTKIYEQATNIALQCCDGETLNAYYNTEVAENIKRLMHYLPLWTGIMKPFFGITNRIATSSSVESEFANIKTRAFKNELPQRIDKFVLHHIDYLDGRIKEASAKFTVLKESIEGTLFPKNILKESENHNAYVDTKSEISISEDSTITKELNNVEDSSSDKLVCNNMSQAEFLSNVSLHSNITSDNVQNISMENVDVHKKSLKIDEMVEDRSLENTYESDLQSNNPLNSNENWGGKITPPKKKKRPNYMDPFPDWDLVQSHKFVDIPLLRNGNVCDSIKFKDKYVSVRNTCAFDSFVQILAHAIGKERIYKSSIQDYELPILKLTQNMLTRGKIMINDYKNRADILQKSNFCKISNTRHIQFLDAKCNVDELIHFVFEDLPSVTRLTKCSNCHYQHCRSLPTLCMNVDILFKKGFNYVQEAINDTENLCANRTLCKECGSNLERTHDYGPHVFLDTSVISDSRYITCKQNVLLENITKTIKLGDKNYSLCGIIDYKGNTDKSPKKLGHYTAIVYTGFAFHEYDDLQTRKSYLQPHKIITPHSIMYVKNE